MRTKNVIPIIPDAELEQLWLQDENIQDAYDRMAHQTLEQFWDDMPRQQDPYDKTEASYVDLRHTDDPGEGTAVVLPLPFANGWAPHMALRAKLLQDSLDVPHRVIVFPNNTAGTHAYSFTKSEQADVASGNFNPLAEKQLNVLQKLNIEKTHWIGYSQGATIGATALKLAAFHDRFVLGESGLFEPPNMVGRNEKELSKAFTGDGIKPLNKAVNDSAIPALSEAQHSKGGLGSLRQLGGFAVFGLGTVKPENKAIKKGFAHPRFIHDLGTAFYNDNQLSVLLASAQNSTITPAELIYDLIEETADDQDAQFQVRMVDGYGHEMGDNIVVHTLLAKLALKLYSRQ